MNKVQLRRFAKVIFYVIVIITTLSIFIILKSNFIDMGTDDVTEDIKAGPENSGIVEVNPELMGFEMEYDLQKKIHLKVGDIKEEVYTVKKGDTWASIAKKLEQDIKVLKANNPKLPEKLKPGQKIKGYSENGIFYTVKKGDKLTSIAKKYKVESSTLLETNLLNNQKLAAGKNIFIPDPTIELAKPVKFGHKLTEYTKIKNLLWQILWPIKWRGVNSGFGYRLHPIQGRVIFHKGVDLKASVGTPVYAAADGVVSFAGELGAYGRLLILQHVSGYATKYAHLSKIYVSPGDHIRKGTLIAATGHSGGTTGPHLHFEVTKNGIPLNPMRFKG